MRALVLPLQDLAPFLVEQVVWPRPRVRAARPSVASLRWAASWIIRITSMLMLSGVFTSPVPRQWAHSWYAVRLSDVCTRCRVISITPNALVFRILVRDRSRLQRLAERLLQVPPVPLVLHVDEVVDDHAAQVAQPELPGDLAGGLQVGLVGGLLGVVADAERAAVDVDRDQGLGLLDDQRAAAGQRNLLVLELLHLLLDLEVVEDRLRRPRAA